MKKIITLFALMVSLFLTSESLSAQNSTMTHEDIAKEAKQKMMKLDEKLNLTDEQEQAVYKQYYSHILNYDKHIEGQEVTAELKNNQAKFDQTLMKTMKKILTEDQYTRYEVIAKEDF